MGFKPLDKMWERVEVARQDSDTSLFLNLLYLGEMLTKIVTTGLVASIVDDPDRHRYQQLHSLVRADGVGDWSRVINDILTGSAKPYLCTSARIEQTELTQKCGVETWQYKAISRLDGCLKKVSPTSEALPAKVQGLKWFSIFAELRNKSPRGHGAPPSSVCSGVCPDLEESIRMLVDNHHLFKRSWAYINRNLSGKYRVTKLTADITPFDSLRSNRSINLPDGDGVYVYFDQPARVTLIESDADAVDFFFPNGAFNSKRFEFISYITGDKLNGDATPYLVPTTELPPSETQGIGILDVQGQCYGNLPPAPKGYVHRQSLEAELLKILKNDRHPVVTLVGTGGLGKTSLALSVLHQVAAQGLFTAIFWFSARDIDLLPDGPKFVKPHIRTEKDVAKEFVRMMAPKEAEQKDFDNVSYLSRALTESPLKSLEAPAPLLFVFDNFETVQSPVELFTWIDSYIRLPNKVLITTRFREFKGDYPIEVPYMNDSECEELVNSTSESLGIRKLITEKYRQDIYRESNGHPYVIKILLGEVAKAGKLVKIERIIASRENILDALFERTFSGLSPAARRVFLTLCNWRSLIPQLALEAVLLRPTNSERIDVEYAIEELTRSSFIQVTVSKEDNMAFLSVPLAASLFGKSKLAVSPMKSAVEADTELLLDFGSTQPSDIQRGIAPRIQRLFRHIENGIKPCPEKLDNYVPILEFIAQSYPPAWMILASLYEDKKLWDKAKEVVKRYLQSVSNNQQEQAWESLAKLCRLTTDWPGEIHALSEICQLPNARFEIISSAANRLNFFFRENYRALDTDEKRIVVRRIAEIMERRLKALLEANSDEVNATDCSRLAWLLLHLRDEERARYYTNRGLALNQNNDYCLKLARKLSIG